MIQKVMKFGERTGVVISKRALTSLGIKVGDRVQIRPVRNRLVKSVDKELMEWTDAFIERYRPALEELAKK